MLFPVNPSVLASFREAFAPSGAKDDPSDAELMLELLLKHRQRLRAWEPDTDDTRTLQFLVEGRRKLVNDRKRLGNRLTSLLKAYYPLVLELFPKMGRVVLCEFVLHYPTLEKVQAASDDELLEFFRSHRSCQRDLLKTRIEAIRSAQPLTNDAPIINSSALIAQSLARQIIAIVESTQDFQKQIQQLYEAHQDQEIFRALPASGEIMAPRMLAAMRTDRERFSSAEELINTMGISPVVERSGKQQWIHWRYHCSKFTRQSFIEWAGVTIKHSLWARAFYAMQRKNGKNHSVAVRALACKWLRIIYRLWKNNEIYSEAKYIEALHKSGSPIIAFMAQNKNLDISALKG